MWRCRAACIAKSARASDTKAITCDLLLRAKDLFVDASRPAASSVPRDQRLDLGTGQLTALDQRLRHPLDCLPVLAHQTLGSANSHSSEQMEVAALQLRHVHAYERNRIMSVNHDDRPCLAVMCLIENL